MRGKRSIMRTVRIAEGGAIAPRKVTEGAQRKDAQQRVGSLTAREMFINSCSSAAEPEGGPSL